MEPLKRITNLKAMSLEDLNKMIDAINSKVNIEGGTVGNLTVNGDLTITGKLTLKGKLFINDKEVDLAKLLL
jgi:hypothetical protein